MVYSYRRRMFRRRRPYRSRRLKLFGRSRLRRTGLFRSRRQWGITRIPRATRELKISGLLFGPTTISNVWAILQMSTVAAGVDFSQRIGTNVKPRYLIINFDTQQNIAADIWYRVVVLKDMKGEESGGLPSATDIFAVDSIDSFLQVDAPQRGRFKIMFDRMYRLSATAQENVETGTGGAPIEASRYHRLRFNLARHGRTTYRGADGQAGSGNAGPGQYYFLICADAVSAITFAGRSRFRYTDV